MKKQTVICYMLVNILLIVPYIFILGFISLGAPIIFIIVWFIVYLVINSCVSLFIRKQRREYIRICIIVPLVLLTLLFFM